MATQQPSLSHVSRYSLFVARQACIGSIFLVLLLLQYVAKGMVERGDGGAIVNVSSQASQCALKHHAVYCKQLYACILLCGKC